MPREDDDDTIETTDAEPAAPRERSIGRDAATPGSRKSNGRRGVGSVNARMGDKFFPEGFVLPSEAELAWPEILHQAEVNGLSPFDLQIQVVQVDPPSPNGDPVTVGNSISGGSVQGNDQESPGMALIRYVTQYYHLPRAASATAVKYQLRFSTRKTSVARAYLVIPNRQEIIALDRADQIRRAAAGEQPPPYMPPPAFQPTPPAASPPSATPGPVGVGVSPSISDTWNLARDMASMMQQGQQMPPQVFDMMMRIMQMSQQHVGVSQAPPPVNEDAIVEKTTVAVVSTLAKLGVIRVPSPGSENGATSTLTPSNGVAAGVAQPPPRSRLERFFDRLQDSVFTEIENTAEQKMRSAVRQTTGVGAPPQEAAETPEAAEPETPQLPWKTTAVPGANWGNGSPIQYTEDTETGGFSMQGFAMANPILLEKGLEVVTGLAGAATKALQKVTEAKPQAPQAPPPQQMATAPAVQAPPPPTEDPNDKW